MMKLLRLYFRMLRYRTAIILPIFFLLAIAFHQKITIFSVNYVWATIALVSSYVVATTINDIADRKIDSINHPLSKCRPLITGDATEKDLYLINFLAAVIVIFFSALISINALLILTLSLLINYIYSLPPFKLSHSVYFAPIVLSVAYVFMPYWLGTTVVSFGIQGQEIFFITGFIFLFFGRIILKDFSDRKGDIMGGKPTFLLRYGKLTTCILSCVSILAGNIFIFLGFPFVSAIIFAILELYFLVMIFMLYKLWKANDSEGEQSAIGIAVKTGNVLLITILGSLILLEYGAPNQIQILFTFVMTFIFLLNFFVLVTKKDYVICVELKNNSS